MITLRHTALGRASLDEWSARRRILYLTTHNSHKRQTSNVQAVFKPAIPASEQQQTHALDRAVIGIGEVTSLRSKYRTLIHTERVHINNILIPCFSTGTSKSLQSFENYLTDMDYLNANFVVIHATNILCTSPRLQTLSATQAINLEVWFEWTVHSSHPTPRRASTSLDIIYTHI